MTALHIHLLGGLNVTWDQAPLPPFSGVVARSLFAYLLTYRDQPHTRDLLAGTFWPDLPDTAARRRLSQALWRVRHALQRERPCPPVLLAEGDSVQLNPDLPFWLDVEEFERQVARGTLPELGAATELYRGDFLAGYYDDWLLVERTRLRDLFLATLERVSEGYKGRGQYEQALTYARRLTTEAPWREEAHREVMRLCHLLGRDNEALKQFDVCRQVLADELGAKPSSETTSLAAEIAERSDVSAPPLVPSAARPTIAPLLERPDRLPLVGRRSELAELLHQVEAAAGGHGGLTVIYGEAGVGKTRLLQDLERNASWRGLQTAWGRCYELAAPLAYQPLVEVLRVGLPALREAELHPLWRAELSRLLPELMPPEGLPPPLSPEEERRRLLEAIAQGFLALVGAAPYLVLLEDAHWMDPASLEALRYLLPRLADAPLLVVLTARPEEVSGQPAALLTALESTRLPHRLALDRLDRSETEELIQRALELAQPASRFSARLYAETEGNAFFLIEILRALVDEGVLYRDEEGSWSTAWDEFTEDYAELPLPTGVVQSVERRLARLPARLERLLGLAAVIGRVVPFDLWRQVSEGSEEGLLAAGNELCARGLFLCTDSDATGADYAFAHDQIRRVTYDRLTPPHRRLYHRRVAQALAHLAPDEPEPLAYHWTQAGVWDQAAGYHQQAGDRARAVYAHAEAAAHYTQALAALEHLAGPETLSLRFQLHLAREAVHNFLSRREAQAEDLAALAALVEGLDDEAQEAQVALRRGMYADTSGDFPAAIEAAQLAVRLAQTAGDVQLEADGQRQWGRALTRQGAFQEARSRLEAALELARRHCLPVIEAVSLVDLGTISARQGDYERASARYEQALRLMRRTGDRQGEAKVLNNLGLVARRQEDYAGAEAYHQQSVHIRREIGDRHGEILALNNLAIIHRHQGDYGRAKLYFEQGLAFQREIGERWYEARALGNLGATLLDLGDYAGAEACYEQSLRIDREIGAPDSEAVSLGGLSRVYHHREDYRAAREHLLAALRLARDLGDRESQHYILIDLGHALTGLGRLAEAADTYHQALTLQRELGRPNMALESLAGLARLSLAQGNLAQASAYVAEILAYLDGGGTLDGIEEPFLVFLTCYRVLQAVQDPRAGAILQTAYDLLQERAARIDDEELRHSYLENVAAHREIVAAYHERQGQRIAARLPRAGAPTGRPLRDDEYVTVTWTVDAPGDKEIRRKPDRRRHRIQRLLAEAQAQGATPRDRDLAQALGVSLPTLRRDMAALRAAGHDLPTRGRKMIT